ncbi:CBU_0592 family membrane protein [Sphaerisporangium dianthi]|uniref:CBU-0592-like domain-containing protein n=1 Tax=Sphaerisporangium dianthi TaxID=1436120 RepID=A0ABV9CGN3_9ACTN
MPQLIDILGMLGAGVLLYAYAMLSMRKMSGDSLAYQLLNLGGAIALMINSAAHLAWPSALLNLVWCGIGILAVWRLVVARPWKRQV